jgi:hypothetical protein
MALVEKVSAQAALRQAQGHGMPCPWRIIKMDRGIIALVL